MLAGQLHDSLHGISHDLACSSSGQRWCVQEEALKVHRPLLVVGTPGRLAELSRAGALLTHNTGASCG